MHRLTIQLAVLLTAAFFGCQDYPFNHIPNERLSGTVVEQVVLTSADTDVLFVIDNSGSMTEEQLNLVNNAVRFVTELSQYDNDYQIGVITTDTNVVGQRDGAPQVDGGKLRMVRADASKLGACGIDPNTDNRPFLVRPPLDASDAGAQRCRLIEDFKATVNSLGTGGSGIEAGLRTALFALGDAASPPEVAQRNAGFLRSDADLALIFLTDEDDCSFDSYSSTSVSTSSEACYEEAGNAISPSEVVRRFAQIKPKGVQQVRAALIGGGVRLTGSEVGGFVASGCRINPGDGAPTQACGCWSSATNEYSSVTVPEPTQRFFCEVMPSDYNYTCDLPESAPCGVSTWCDAVPATRYNAFIRELGNQRLASAAERGTYEESICQHDFGATLEAIVHSIIDTPCFPAMPKPVTSSESVQLIYRASVSSPDEKVVPRLGDPGCASCGACNGPNGHAWQLNPDNKTICLKCNDDKDPGSVFSLQVLHEDTFGQEEDGAADGTSAGKVGGKR